MKCWTVGCKNLRDFNHVGLFCDECLRDSYQQLVDKLRVQVEVHADGIKEITCGSCSEPCGNEWCCMNEGKK